MKCIAVQMQSNRDALAEPLEVSVRDGKFSETKFPNGHLESVFVKRGVHE